MVEILLSWLAISQLISQVIVREGSLLGFRCSNSESFLLQWMISDVGVHFQSTATCHHASTVN